jgi:phage-related minor tail protein
VGGFISGFLADGGTAQAGRSYIVGERGPELFVPRSTGTVVPNEAMGAAVGGEVTVNFNINAVDAASFDELLLSRKGLIVGTIQQAFRQQGRRFA